MICPCGKGKHRWIDIAHPRWEVRPTGDWLMKWQICAINGCSMWYEKRMR